MRYLIMHRTNAHWEAGASPTPELIARVGGMLGALAKAGTLLEGEGLRASSHGVRLQFTGGQCVVTDGPFGGGRHVPAGFAIFRVGSLDEAVAASTRLAEVLGDVDIDVRPVTEAWDIGLEPIPEGLTTRRYMALYARPAEASPPKDALDRRVQELTREGVLIAAVGLEPSAKGARVATAGGRRVVTDGPFAESKELVAGYVIVAVPSLAEAKAIGVRYAEVVDSHEVDVREVSERP